ncbi:hypothetical protein [Nocardioides pelophilus]|uniref:hypothetical protein n=1 Tax=Nocardioides pelophilus TaxID=2172019 RepID=UPI0015FF0ADF|nr:hypothetical protein [Nocardioides pelophilus]
MRARSARATVLAVAVAAALVTAGPGFGLADDGSAGSTRGAQTEKAAPPGSVRVPATTNMKASRGVKPSDKIPAGSTRTAQPPAVKAGPTKVVDRSDKGVKNLRPTKDRGTKNLPPRRDLGDR